jgi:transcriptional regulator
VRATLHTFDASIVDIDSDLQFVIRLLKGVDKQVLIARAKGCTHTEAGRIVSRSRQHVILIEQRALRRARTKLQDMELFSGVWQL